MITKTEAIVLKTIRYSDHSLIAKVYSRTHGVLSLMIRSGKKRNKQLRNYFNPLSQLNIVIYYSDKKNIHQLKEVSFSRKSSLNENNIPVNSLKFFLAEVLSKIIGEEETNQGLFNFIYESIDKLNESEKELASFHLTFLYELSSFLGIKPNLDGLGKYFDLREAQVVTNTPLHSDFVDEQILTTVKDYFCKGKKINKRERKLTLDFLLSFYQIHLGGLEKIKSREVMEVVFS